MRQLGWALVATASLMALGAPIAQAGITCKIIPSWCPAHKFAKNEKGGTREGITQSGTTREDEVDRTSVPEPASLLLLGAGVSAVGAAVARRRRRK